MGLVTSLLTVISHFGFARSLQTNALISCLAAHPTKDRVYSAMTIPRLSLQRRELLLTRRAGTNRLKSFTLIFIGISPYLAKKNKKNSRMRNHLKSVRRNPYPRMEGPSRATSSRAGRWGQSQCFSILVILQFST